MEINNKLICDFMKNYTYQSDSGVNWIEINGYPFAEFNDAPFHLSWDWLMPLVEKIESLGGIVYITSYAATINKSKLSQSDISIPFNLLGKTKIQGVYKAIIEFITWYNQNK